MKVKIGQAVGIVVAAVAVVGGGVYAFTRPSSKVAPVAPPQIAPQAPPVAPGFNPAQIGGAIQGGLNFFKQGLDLFGQVKGAFGS